MAMYGTMHMYTHEQVEITCEHQLNERRPEGYPVLAIGTLTVYPTRERLERLRDVIDAYLAAHPERREEPGEPGEDEPDTFACRSCGGGGFWQWELSDGVCDKCEDRGVVPDRADRCEVGYPSAIRCDHCSNPTGGTRSGRMKIPPGPRRRACGGRTRDEGSEEGSINDRGQVNTEVYARALEGPRAPR